MADFQKPEISESVRVAAEQGLTQARQAYKQFMDLAKQAQAKVAESTGAMAASAHDAQRRAVEFAEQNVDAGLSFAADIAKARSLQEVMDIQQRYARRQMELCRQQAQELGSIMAEASQKVTPKP